MSKIEQLLQDIHNELGADFISIDVVGADGLSIASRRATAEDTSANIARLTMVMKLAIRVAEKLNVGEVEDDLITTDTSYIMARVLGNESYFVVLSLSKNAALGVARMLINEYADQLWNAIPR